jgi:hypothetical protein
MSKTTELESLTGLVYRASRWDVQHPFPDDADFETKVRHCREAAEEIGAIRDEFVRIGSAIIEHLDKKQRDLAYRLHELLCTRYYQVERKYHRLICGEWQEKGVET